MRISREFSWLISHVTMLRGQDIVTEKWFSNMRDSGDLGKPFQWSAKWRSSLRNMRSKGDKKDGQSLFRTKKGQEWNTVNWRLGGGLIFFFNVKETWACEMLSRKREKERGEGGVERRESKSGGRGREKGWWTVTHWDGERWFLGEPECGGR